jgi:hypothetical protein
MLPAEPTATQKVEVAHETPDSSFGASTTVGVAETDQLLAEVDAPVGAAETTRIVPSTDSTAMRTVVRRCRSCVPTPFPQRRGIKLSSLC